MALLQTDVNYIPAKLVNNHQAIAYVNNIKASSTRRIDFILHHTGADNVRGAYLLLLGKSYNQIEKIHNHSEAGSHSNHSYQGFYYGDQGLWSANSHTHSAVGQDYSGKYPKTCQIWIDGIDRSVALGGTWGSGTAEFTTGMLNIISYIDLNIQNHYIEIKETGGNGGFIQAQIFIL